MTEAIKPVRRKTFASYRGRQVIVSIHPTWVGVRLAGTRKEYQVDAVALFHFGARLEADKRRNEKIAQKKALAKLKGERQ